MKFETFIDLSYYDMWCVKPINSKSFYLTLHFTKKQEALHAIAVIETWLQQERQVLADRCMKSDRYRGDYFASLILKEKHD